MYFGTMKLLHRLFASTTAVMFCALVLCASASYAQQPRSVPLNQDPATAVQAFESASDGEYTLAPGDHISVDVVGRPELTGKHIIGPDGRITLPFEGAVLVAGHTRESAASEIRNALKKDYENPTIIVGVDLYTSNHVVLLGAVARPGLLSFDEPPTLLSVMAQAGSQVQGIGVIQGKTTSVPELVSIFRGNHSVVRIEFKKLLESGSPLVQMRLQRNDIVYVPSPNEQFISIFGEVLHPGMLQLQDGADLTQLLAESGGIVTDLAGRYPKIQIIHQSNGNIQVIDYKDLLASKPMDIRFYSGDIIYVPESKFSRAAVTFTKISPLVSLATVGTIVARP